MSDIYSDQYDSVTSSDSPGLVPPSLVRVAGAVVFIGLIAGMSLWAYRLGTRDASAVPIIRAMEGPARIQPEDPGGVQAAHQGLEVNEVLAGRPAVVPAPAVPRATPPPVVLTEEDGPQGELILPPAEPFALSEAELPDELPLPVQEESPVPLNSILAPEIEPEPAAEPDPPAVAAGPRPRSRPANLPRLAAPTPAATPAPAPAASATAPQQQAAAPREVTSVPAGTRLVQLGAFDSEVLARQVWDQLVGRHGDLLGSKSLFIERTTANARVFYRLRVAGFQNADQTRVMCESLRARGVDCIPVTLQ